MSGKSLDQMLTERKELAELIADTLKAHGIATWYTIGRFNVRTNASIAETRKALADVDYPAHLIGANTSYSKSATSEFTTLVKTA